MKQKEKKRIASKLFAALVVLTLISCCFVGTTFARYTSGDSGVASVQVANWYVSIAPNGTTVGDETIASFGDLSPNMNTYSGESYDINSARKNTTPEVLVATIEYNCEVDADITITAGNVAYYNGNTPVENPDYDLSGVFTINLYYSTTSGTWDDSNTSNTITSGTKLELANKRTGTLYIFASVTWTSDTSSTNFGSVADERDTWIGGNITELRYNISYTAVQASQTPASN